MRVLVVEDDPQFGSMVRNLLETEGIEIELAVNPSEAFEKLMATPIDTILLDLTLGDQSGMSVLRELHESGSTTPIVVMTGQGSIETVAEAMQLNAFEYMTKPFAKDQILEVLRRALLSNKQKGETKKEITGKTIQMIGQSPRMIEVYKAIARISKTDSTVLITGENGTGKELAARSIHEGSTRSRKPFITVNCGAFTEALLESELFGHVKGALAGASVAHRGILESASGGTVFLDEINETVPAFQVKLLRMLQQRTIKPVGSNEERPADIRVIASTTQPVEKLLLSSFRRDLLYKLSVIHIHIPALRERQDDIPLLTHHFLIRCNNRQRKSVTIPDATIQWIKTLPWEGNIRELENAIERAVTLNGTGVVQIEDLISFGLRPETVSTFSSVAPESEKSQQTIEQESRSLDEMTRDHILTVLKSTGGNKLRTAQILGIGRYSLYRMANRLGIDLDHLTLEARDRKPKLEKKQEVEKGLDDLFDNVNDIIYTRDLDGTITSLNAAGERFFGHPRSEIVGGTLHELFHDPDIEKNLRATNERLIKQGVDRSVVSMMDRNGKLRHLEFNVSLMRDENGDPSGARGIMRDVTEAKELEQELRNRTKELEESNEKLKELDRIKADFTAMLVHDLKTPAATMILALEFLQERFGGKADRIEEVIATGLTSGRTILQLVEDMLDIFRFESNKMELRRSVLTIPELLHDPMQEASLQAEKKGINFYSELDENLPPVSVDSPKMMRAVSNLLSNAFKFTPAGGKVILRVTTGKGSGVNSDSTYVDVCVVDTGQGIPTEHLSYIFDPYWQTPLKGVGTGLGLAVVKRIVSAHGGLVFVRSKLGVGSEFHIALPAMI
ncbi:sigma 54-interacting transcriptional regulator [bacterium]|nr:sigma 54-interacting transcriptional regulator [bacterium]